METRHLEIVSGQQSARTARTVVVIELQKDLQPICNDGNSDAPTRAREATQLLQAARAHEVHPASEKSQIGPIPSVAWELKYKIQLLGELHPW